MAAQIVGTYDASTFVEFDYATYPQLPPGVPFYQVGMGWLVTVAGTVHGQDVQPQDVLFAVPKPRLYGDFTYGGKVYGSKPVNLDDWEDWLVDEVQFLAWDGNALPPDQAPYPNSGCPFTPAHGFGGEWAPGWRIVVDCWYNDRPGRRYGNLAYGDEVYGAAGRAEPHWVDITQPSFHIEVGDGMAEGGPRVSVSELVVNFVDPVGRWFDIATPQTWLQPQPGAALRVGLLDPQYRYHPLITAEIERIEDVHDGEGVREVSVRGFGRIMDLVVDLPRVQRPRELASTRFNWFVQAAGWRWDTDPIAFPATGDSTLMTDPPKDPGDAQARAELDRVCSAVGWYMDSTRQGRIRVRSWPIEPQGEPITVVDCYGYPADLVSHSMVFANDQSQLLNYVMTTNIEDASVDPALPNVSVVSEDAMSVARFGKRGRSFGFPQTGLAWSDPAAAKVWADRAVARYAFITRQCESFDIDTAVDHGWLTYLADLDTGRWLIIHRTGFSDLRLDGVVTGWRWRLDPGRWQGTVFVSTITPSM